MLRYRIEPTQLMRGHDPITTLPDTSHSLCVGIIKQLSCLSLVSNEMFCELLSTLSCITERTVRLTDRVTYLASKTSGLSAASEVVSLDDVIAVKPFQSSKVKDVSLTVRPQCLLDTYDKAQPIPALERLNVYRRRQSLRRFVCPKASWIR
jgi:hypothetical protein